jgi:hypothetical protein
MEPHKLYKTELYYCYTSSLHSWFNFTRTSMFPWRVNLIVPLLNLTHHTNSPYQLFPLPLPLIPSHPIKSSYPPTSPLLLLLLPLLPLRLRP